jgi:hypothetical protein
MTRAAAWLGIAGQAVAPHIVLVEPPSSPADVSSVAAASLLGLEPDDEQLDDDASRANGAHVVNSMAESKDRGVMTGTSLCHSPAR